MGNETKCTVRLGTQKSEGKTLLETSELIFRGEKFRLKIALGKMRSVKAVNGELRIAFAKENAIFELGPLAEKWANKILHPKTVMEKLGVRADSSVVQMGRLGEDFLQKLRGRTKKISDGSITADTEWIFLGAESRRDLEQIKKFARVMKGAAALWVVYPKGQKAITEKDVLTAGRAAGLKDVKVVGFSATHTALKFVIPVLKR